MNRRIPVAVRRADLRIGIISPSVETASSGVDTCEMIAPRLLDKYNSHYADKCLQTFDDHLLTWGLGACEESR